MPIDVVIVHIVQGGLKSKPLTRISIISY